LLTNGTVSAANFSLKGPDGDADGGGAGEAVVGTGDAIGASDGEDIAAMSLLAGVDPLEPSGIFILAKYRKPPTPIATIHTTAAGHIQLGVVAAPEDLFFTFGIE
jgi:hypothetical protein